MIALCSEIPFFLRYMHRNVIRHSKRSFFKKKEKFAWIHLGEELEPHAPPQNEPKAWKFEICQNSAGFDLLFHTQFVIP